MSTSSTPRPRNTDAFFVIGLAFMVLGFTNPAFLVIGIVFFVIGVSGRARKTEDTTPGEGPEAS